MTNAQPLEIELKLALPPQQLAAFQKRMARRRSVGQEQVMLTRYFDTPDFALSGQGIALRVRRVGRQWLQTLKTEGERRGGLSQRLEYEHAIRRGCPDWSRFPEAAQARVPEALRAQLVPLFETHFQRTAWLLKGKGGAQIEVALDVGEVRTLEGINAGPRAQPICEIELELKQGDPDALFALAESWAQQFDFLPLDISKAERGVRLAREQASGPVKSAAIELDKNMRVEDGFAAIIQACLTQFQANLSGVLSARPPAGGHPDGQDAANAGPTATDDAIEYVHQARVALRRLRAVLRLYRRVCVPPPALMDGLRALAAALGPTRDWDVLCSETLPQMAPHYPNPKVWQQGYAAMSAQRDSVRAAMRVSLQAARPGAWLLAMQRWLLQHGWRLDAEGEAVSEAQRFVQLSPLTKWARAALRKGHRPIEHSVPAFAQFEPAQRHALRIAIKRQRYACEFFQSLFGRRRQARYLAALQSLQDQLGRSNDARVAWERVSSMQAETGAMGQFALGWLAAVQREMATEAILRQLQNFVKFRTCW